MIVCLFMIYSSYSDLYAEAVRGAFVHNYEQPADNNG